MRRSCWKSSAQLRSEVTDMGKKYNGELTRLGTFELTGPVLRVSDPCYDRDVWCSATIENCKPGNWETAVLMQDEGDWGIRNAVLIARHTDSEPGLKAYTKVLSGTDKTWQECPFDVGVDSGQAGIFDDAYYQDDSVFAGSPAAKFDEDNSWYSHCCDITMSQHSAGVLPYGVVSCSGFGDGGYVAYRHVDQDGKTDAVFIVFIED